MKRPTQTPHHNTPQVLSNQFVHRKTVPFLRPAWVASPPDQIVVAATATTAAANATRHRRHYHYTTTAAISMADPT